MSCSLSTYAYICILDPRLVLDRLWRKGRHETAAWVHWVIYSVLAIIALTLALFGDFF